MDIREKERIARVRRVFEDNFRLTHMYSVYLERFPELINKEMINALTCEGEMTVKDAIVAILAEAFGIDGSEGGEALRFLRNYLIPSIRLMDPKKYTSNPYYKNIKIENVSLGRWELRQEKYPAFRGVIAGDMMLLDGYREIAPLGFFAEDFHFPAVLEDGNEWMTLTPVDLDTCDEPIARAQGKVLTYGLGLGYFAYMASIKDDVESVTVVERDENVIALFESVILPQFPNADKIKIVKADAYQYFEQVMPAEAYDYVFVDVWRDASDGTPFYEWMKPREKLCPGTVFDYWIEGFLASRSRAIRYSELCEKMDSGATDAPTTFDEFIRCLDGNI